MAGELLVPLLTPLAADQTIDGRALAQHALGVLAAGATGVVVFGLASDAASFSAAERMAGLEALLDEGVNAGAVVVGAAAAALPDSQALGRHALLLGCRAILLLPSFPFDDVVDHGLIEWHAEVDAKVDAHARQVGIGCHRGWNGPPLAADTLARIVDRLGERVWALFDSGGAIEHTRELAKRFPAAPLLVGHEPNLARAMKEGAAGGICLLANLAPSRLRRVVDGSETAEDHAAIEALAEQLASVPTLPAIRALLAESCTTPAWQRVRLPLLPLDARTAAALAEACEPYLAPERFARLD